MKNLIIKIAILTRLIKLNKLFIVLLFLFNNLLANLDDTLNPNEVFYLGFGPSYNLTRYTKNISTQLFDLDPSDGAPVNYSSPLNLNNAKIHKNRIGEYILLGYNRPLSGKVSAVSFEIAVNFLNTDLNQTDYKDFKLLLNKIAVQNNFSSPSTNNFGKFIVHERAINFTMYIMPLIQIMPHIFINLSIYPKIGIGSKVLIYSTPSGITNILPGNLGLNKNFSKMIFGLALGGGIQLHLSKNASIRGEYLYNKFNRLHMADTSSHNFILINQDHSTGKSINTFTANTAKYDNIYDHTISATFIKKFTVY